MAWTSARLKCYLCGELARVFAVEGGEIAVTCYRCADSEDVELTELPRIGVVMLDALKYLDKRGGSTKRAVAACVGPRGSEKYGYRVVDRCISAGLVKAKGSPRRYALALTDKGRAVLWGSTLAG